MVDIPKMVKIKQHFNREKLSNVDQAVKEEIEKVGVRIKNGMIGNSK